MFFLWNFGVVGIFVVMENMFIGIWVVFSVVDEKCDFVSDERFF